MRILIIICMLSLFLTSCASQPKLVPVNKVLGVNSSPTFKGHYYLGSDQNYHYLLEKWQYGRNRRYKVSKTELTIFNERPYKSVELRVSSYPGSKAIGKTDKRTFYGYKAPTSKK